MPNEPTRAGKPETMRERAEREMGRPLDQDEYTAWLERTATPLDQDEYTAWLERTATRLPTFATTTYPRCPTSLTGHPNGCRCR